VRDNFLDDRHIRQSIDLLATMVAGDVGVANAGA
jgi:hypothetical protein